MFNLNFIKFLLITTLASSYAYDESQCVFYRFRKPLDRLDFLVCVIDVQLPETVQVVYRQRNEPIRGLIIGGADTVNDEALRIFEEFPAVTYYGLLLHNIEAVTKENFAALAFLEGLDIANGKLIKIDQDAFQDLTRLIDVDLSKNQLDYIHPNTFSYLPNLEKLQLNDNNLIALEMDTFTHNRKLNLLNLRNNKFSFIYPRVFEGLYGLRELYLAGNPCISNDYKPPRIPSFRLLFAQQCRESAAVLELLNERRLDFEVDYDVDEVPSSKRDY